MRMMLDLQEAKSAYADSDLVFVYGTLKNGYHNNPILGNSEYIGEYKTDKKFDLVNCSPKGGFPFLIAGNHSVIGEVYKVDNFYTLAYLDCLESHPYGYNRRLMDIEGLDKKVWYYFYPHDTERNKVTIENVNGSLKWSYGKWR